MSAIKDGKAAGLHYRASLPVDHASKRAWPWILFLHGRGERGNANGSELQLVQRHGPWHSLWNEDFVIIAPQCPRGKLWHALITELIEFISIISQRYALDKQRGYCTGLSLGGFACWTLASAAPHSFAAIAPICAGFVQKDSRKDIGLTELQRLADGHLDVSTVKHLPAWIFHGQKDKIVLPRLSEKIYKALKETHHHTDKTLRLTLFMDKGHSCWKQTFALQELKDWFLSFRSPKRVKKDIKTKK